MAMGESVLREMLGEAADGNISPDIVHEFDPYTGTLYQSEMPNFGDKYSANQMVEEVSEIFTSCTEMMKDFGNKIWSKIPGNKININVEKLEQEIVKKEENKLPVSNIVFDQEESVIAPAEKVEITSSENSESKSFWKSPRFLLIAAVTTVAAVSVWVLKSSTKSTSGK